MKLVPSMDNGTESIHRMSVVGGPSSSYTGLNSAAEYEEGTQDGDSPYFHEWNTKKRTVFPGFKFNKDTVPNGSSIKMCLGLQWIVARKKHILDKMLGVRDLPGCIYTEKIKVDEGNMNDDYLQRGLNFGMWQQVATAGESAFSCHLHYGVFKESN